MKPSVWHCNFAGSTDKNPPADRVTLAIARPYCTQLAQVPGSAVWWLPGVSGQVEHDMTLVCRSSRLLSVSMAIRLNCLSQQKKFPLR